MNDRQRRENERNIRSNNFLDENSTDFVDNAVAKLKIAALNQQVAQTQTELQKQISGDSDVTRHYTIVEDAFDALVDEMRGIRDFARSMEGDIRGLEEKFRLPTGGSKRKYIAAARVSVEDAGEFKEQFIDYGMGEDFIDELRAKADALEQALDDAAASTGEHIGATDTLEQIITEANGLVESLDPIVRRIYRADPTKRAAWIYVSHVERHTSKPRPAKNINTDK
ncbi:MAG: hypothetical protein ACR2N3_00860 [Pyrinomonadaceae bacterium]